LGFQDFKQTMLSGKRLVGTFLKTPSHELVEVLSVTGLDFICIDGEHSAFDRHGMDACLSIARALDFPALVRVPAAKPEYILQALDSGAAGVVCPHIDSVDKAEAVAKAAHFGLGGRGFAGATRWAGLERPAMADVLAKSALETIVIAQIEEPAGVDAAAEIAAVNGINGLFIGPADLSVSYGKTDTGSDELREAYRRVGLACRDHGKANITFILKPDQADALSDLGVSVFLIGADHSLMAEAAQNAVGALRD